ncbi:kinase-like domain-containing protein [Coprinopsis sp. MPI-PUGE-AT-0042]|nr:kinase-like domain-containing protein [Coprinopsis sp. MPI-PUGE-AT-0042]
MELFQYWQGPGVESYTMYRPGGFHPVHLGDKFKDGRYTVVHKLGYGSLSTVWLVRDEAQGSLVSLKILSADAEEESSGAELDVLRRLAAGSGQGKRFVLRFLDSFVHRGPNGEHLCVVTEVSGPNLATYLDVGEEEADALTPELARALTLQVAQGLDYLHSCGIIHGDLHLGNLLYHLPVLSTLKSPEDIEKYFGAPNSFEIRLREGRSPLFAACHLPRYVVQSPDDTFFFEQLFHNPSLAELRICDFGDSYLNEPANLPRGVTRKLNLHNIHAAPEVIFDNLVSPASDIWAMGNIIHQIMTGSGTDSAMVIPGSEDCSRDVAVRGMVRVFGKLPERWWNRWEKRSEFFDEEGTWIAEESEYYRKRPLGARIPDSFLPGGQKESFVKVLSKMFVYEPESRLTARALVKELTSAISEACQ